MTVQLTYETRAIKEKQSDRRERIATACLTAIIASPNHKLTALEEVARALAHTDILMEELKFRENDEK